MRTDGPTVPAIKLEINLNRRDLIPVPEIQARIPGLLIELDTYGKVPLEHGDSKAKTVVKWTSIELDPSKRTKDVRLRYSLPRVKSLVSNEVSHDVP